MAECISSRVQEAWSKAQVFWRGEVASAFQRQYILPMQETAEQFDVACRGLADRTQLLDQELSAIESELSE